MYVFINYPMLLSNATRCKCGGDVSVAVMRWRRTNFAAYSNLCNHAFGFHLPGISLRKMAPTDYLQAYCSCSLAACRAEPN